jgi:hypothetical protein
MTNQGIPSEESEIYEIGGIRIGDTVVAFNATVPFVALTATRSELQLDYPGGKFVFPRKSVNVLRKHRGFFSKGVRIEHTLIEHPEFIVFWTFHFKRVKAKLLALGYEFQE